MRRARCCLLLFISTATVVAYIIFIGDEKFLEPNADTVADLYSSSVSDNRPLGFDENRSGQPEQVILVTTWRSGSSFIGRLLASVPDVLYYFEPLFYLPNFQFRIQGPPGSDEAITLLRTLLKCNHSLLAANDGLIQKAAFFLPRFNSSTKICGAKMTLCRKPEFTEALCQKAPIHIMKVVRMHLNLVESLLADNSLRLRVLYLVRDPRGTLNSRWKVKFLSKYDREPSVLCADLVSEFHAAKRLHEKFPNHFKVVRYEDVAEDASSVTEEILRFLGFEMHPRVVEFIEEYTHKQEKGNLNIKRNSSYTACRWIKELSWDSIATIQNNSICRKAMRFWGYKIATNVSIQQEFVPYLNRSEYDFERIMKTGKS